MASTPDPQTLKELGLAIYNAAIEYLRTLHLPQHDTRNPPIFPPYAVLPFESQNRYEWYFLPYSLVPRAGLPLRSMNPEQRLAALELLRTSTSAAGYRYADVVRQLEFLLRELELNVERPFRRDAEAYHFTIFGTPSETGTWGWRYEGHHCSLHWTMTNGEVVASTPQFLGTSPAEVTVEAPGGPRLGTRLLAEQEDLARALIASLDPAQRDAAILAGAVPDEITTRNAPIAVLPDGEKDRGLIGARMTGDQRELVRRLFAAYASVMPGPVAAERLRRIAAANVPVGDATLTGIEGVRFAWIGPTESGPLHYYRLFQDESVLLEYDTPMLEPYHRHTVWRDFRNDYGLDVLARARAEARGALRGEASARLGLGPEWGPDPLAHHYLVSDHDAARGADHHHHDHDEGHG